MAALPLRVSPETIGEVEPQFQYDEFDSQDITTFFLESRIVPEKREEDEYLDEEKLESKTEMLEKDATDTLKGLVPLAETEPRVFIPIKELLEEAAKKRETKILELIIRRETQEIIEELFSDRQVEYIDFFRRLIPSKRHAHTFADLINENLLTIDKEAFGLTDVFQRFMKGIVEDKL